MEALPWQRAPVASPSPLFKLTRLPLSLVLPWHLCHVAPQVVTVRVIDACPCRQVLSDTAPGVRAGGEVRRQEWCCGGGCRITWLRAASVQA